MTVTRPVAFGKSVLILAGASGNWTIKEGSADASTLTVGATCPEVPNAGVRKASAVVGKAGEPLLVVVVLVVLGVGVPDENGLEQADRRMASNMIPRTEIM
jgi:hypothetical protein